MLDSLFKYAKFMYECGNYEASAIYLSSFLNIVPKHDGNYLDSLYGKLGSEILIQNWAHAKVAGFKKK
jgi:translation initiation factor 3 subunit E